MRGLSRDPKDDNPRKHLEWTGPYHQTIVEGPGPALRSADEAESARAALRLANENLDRLRGDLASIQTARIATANMRSMATTSGESTFWKGDHMERAHEAACITQLADQTALIADYEARIQAWDNGDELPPEEPPKINPLSDDEARFYAADPAIVLQRANGNPLTNAGRPR